MNASQYVITADYDGSDRVEMFADPGPAQRRYQELKDDRRTFSLRLELDDKLLRRWERA